MSKRYSEEFKKEIVSLRQSGQKECDLRREYGLGKNTIRDWVIASSNPRTPQQINEQNELKAIKKQLKKQQEEIELLKHLALLHIQTNETKSSKRGK